MTTSSASRPLVLALPWLLLIAAVASSLLLGARTLSVETLRAVLTGFDPLNFDHVVLRDMRIGRTAAAALTGAALAMAGHLMQGLTRNPLADPGLLGVNAGAALIVVLVLWTLGPQPALTRALVAVAGAGAAAFLVWMLAGPASGAGPEGMVRLALSGAAVSTLCLSLVMAVMLISTEIRGLMRFWTVGSLSGPMAERLTAIAPLIALGGVLAALSCRGLDALALGEDAAKGLGTRPGRTLALALGATALLAGGAVALAGPLGFVGLIVPNLTRRLAGPGAGRGLALAIPLGAATVLICDVLARVLMRPEELAPGVLLSLVGGPVFVLLLLRLGSPR